MDFEKLKKINSYSQERIEMLSNFDEPLQSMTGFTYSEWHEWQEIKKEIMKEDKQEKYEYNHEEIMNRLKSIEDELIKMINRRREPDNQYVP